MIDKFINSIIFLFAYIYITILSPIILLIIQPILNIAIDWSLMDINSYNYIYILLGVCPNIIKDEKLINKGFILANHRCWLDFSYDPYFTKASILGRRIAFYAVSFFYILGCINNRMILFTRGKADRKQIYNLMDINIKTNSIDDPENGRVVFYPEGTRQDYLHLNNKDEICNKLKKGLLKEIYNRKDYPVQLFISSNKEKVFNEKQLFINCGINVKSILTESIHPKDYIDFDHFLDKICIVWYDAWKRAYQC